MLTMKLSYCITVMCVFFQTQHSQREDELNGKLTEYLQKLEDMTRQLGDVNSRLQECEDNKVRRFHHAHTMRGGGRFIYDSSRLLKLA